MEVNTDKNKIEEILNRGVISEILPTKDGLMELLASGKKLKMYIGADPTSTSLHLSHAKNYMLLEEFRQLGHEVYVLFGTFTAQIGDPTGKSATRNQLSEETIKENIEGWVTQIRPLLNFDDQENPPKIVHNGDWLSKLTFSDLIPIAAQFTVQQMIERDMFEKRWNQGVAIHLHEFLYPLMQGYDSVALEVDIELCGTDQIFNALAGRTLLKRFKNKDKFVVAVNLMANPKTGELMSKSNGTGVFLASGANEMFGAIMAQPDEMIEILFVNNTRIPLSEKESIMAMGPRNAKAFIARDIVKRFYGEEQSVNAEEHFVNTFQKKEIPDDAQEITIGDADLSAALVEHAIVTSNSEAKRLVEAGAIKHMESNAVLSFEDIKKVPEKGTYKIGKNRFVKFV